jgi:hypothetical protein
MMHACHFPRKTTFDRCRKAGGVSPTVPVVYHSSFMYCCMIYIPVDTTGTVHVDLCDRRHQVRQIFEDRWICSDSELLRC